MARKHAADFAPGHRLMHEEIVCSTAKDPLAALSLKITAAPGKICECLASRMSSCSRWLRQWWGRLIYLGHHSISGAGKPLCALRDLPGKHEGVAFLCPRRPQKKRVSVDYLRVLIIDDSLTIRAMLEELIEREEGCRVVGMASSVNDARSMMIDLIPTVVTLDLNMPGIDGLTFLDQLSGKVHVPVVVVSSATSAGSPQAAEAIKRGAYACFDKANILSETTKFVRLLKAAGKAGSVTAAPSRSF